jgi:hypothetical protein
VSKVTEKIKTRSKPTPSKNFNSQSPVICVFRVKGACVRTNISGSSGQAIDKKQSSEMDLPVEELEHVGHGKDVANSCSIDKKNGNTDA